MIHRPWKINISSVVLVEISNDRIDTSFHITGDNIWIVSIRYDISTMGIGKYITQATSTTSFSRYIYPRYWGNVSWDWQQSQSLTAVSVIDSSLNHWQQSQSLTAVSIIDSSLNHWQQSQSLTAEGDQVVKRRWLQTTGLTTITWVRARYSPQLMMCPDTYIYPLASLLYWVFQSFATSPISLVATT